MEPFRSRTPLLVAGFGFDCASAAPSRSIALRRVRVAPVRAALGDLARLILDLVLRVALLRHVAALGLGLAFVGERQGAVSTAVERTSASTADSARRSQ